MTAFCILLALGLAAPPEAGAPAATEAATPPTKEELVAVWQDYSDRIQSKANWEYRFSIVNLTTSPPQTNVDATGTFMCDGNSAVLMVDNNQFYQSVGQSWRCDVVGNNPDYGFLLTRPDPSAKWSATTIEMHVEDDVPDQTAFMSLDDLRRLPLMLERAYLVEVVRLGIFEITSTELVADFEVDGKRIAAWKLTFTVDHAKGAGNWNTPHYVRGDVVLDPARHWLPVAANWEFSYPAPIPKMHDETTFHKFETRNGLSYPTQITTKHFYDGAHGATLDTHWKRIDKDPQPEDFRLTAFGLVDPVPTAPKSRDLMPYWTTAVIAVLLIALGIYWARRGSRAHA